MRDILLFYTEQLHDVAMTHYGWCHSECGTRWWRPHSFSFPIIRATNQNARYRLITRRITDSLMTRIAAWFYAHCTARKRQLSHAEWYSFDRLNFFLFMWPISWIMQEAGTSANRNEKFPLRYMDKAIAPRETEETCLDIAPVLLLLSVFIKTPWAEWGNQLRRGHTHTHGNLLRHQQFAAVDRRHYTADRFLFGRCVYEARTLYGNVIAVSRATR